MSTQVQLGGAPTAPIVKRLEEKWPDPTSLRGVILKHEEIEALIGEPRDSSRYRTCFSAWRRKVARESGVYISGRGVGGEGFRVLSHGDQASFSSSELSSGMRKARRAQFAAANTDDNELTPEARRVKQHVLMSVGRLQAAMLVRAPQQKKLKGNGNGSSS